MFLLDCFSYTIGKKIIVFGICPPPTFHKFLVSLLSESSVNPFHSLISDWSIFIAHNDMIYTHTHIYTYIYIYIYITYTFMRRTIALLLH